MKTENKIRNNFPQIPLHKEAVDFFQFSQKSISFWNFLCFQESREFRFAAYKINTIRKQKSTAEKIPYAKPSDLNAAALINAVYQRVFSFFEKNLEPSFQKQILSTFKEKNNPEKQSTLLALIQEKFPYNSNASEAVKVPDLWIRAIIIRLNNQNPALSDYLDLFSDSDLMSNPSYSEFMKGFKNFFKKLSPLKGGESDLSILDFLLEPIKKFPNSLYDQLLFMKEHWDFLIEDLLDDFLFALDFLKEEYKPVFTGFGHPQAPDYGLLNDEYEAFTDDKNWMPNVVMLAKSTLVWLSQLSKKYQKPIQYLHQIPDKELQLIRSRGFNAIWLIGLWERSSASKRIKHICGNPNAEASAYSLFDYEIADALGGWPALENLRKRCHAIGLRLASDMVPNHTGIDSRWVVENPDLFLQLPYNPMPHYSFSGVDLCNHNEVGIFLEDKYYNKTDCAVVFKRLNYQTGEERYIYHGNDGTGLPWNDTAQLDFLNPKTREAVIQTILHVARNFSIIRFDAAMTLAKKHIQRLWYPAPGQGGDIPTRSEFALPTVDFNKAIPKEFWREVVDRIAQEAPDTLLLAEAFWMLEGYFVRTLGMHRVYNSAFMHMLRDEHNQKFRNLIKETLDFDPQILKRYVNFMNNPDEETAAEQFGKGDKYFGICMFLCTIPGLPMFGHGQIEGFYEKYGMEFRTPQWDESPDEAFIKRHEKEIFPLMRKRYLFSEVENFRLYNFDSAPNCTNENVYAYSNRVGKENILIVYNNCYQTASGSVKTGVPFRKKDSDDHFVPDFNEFLYNVAPRPSSSKKVYLVFTEQKSNLDYIRSYEKVWNEGLFCLLQGYEYQIFTHFQAVIDEEGFLTIIEEQLKGRGLEDLLFEATLLKYQKAHQAFEAFLQPKGFQFAQTLLKNPKDEAALSFFNEFISNESAFSLFEERAKNQKEFPLLAQKASLLRKELQKSLALFTTFFLEASKVKDVSNEPHAFIAREFALSKTTLPLFFGYALISSIKKISSDLVKETALPDFIRLTLKQASFEREVISQVMEALEIMVDFKPNQLLDKEFFFQEKIQKKLGINEYNRIIWFHLPPFESLLSWLFLHEILTKPKEAFKKESVKAVKNFEIRHKALLQSEYRLEQFLANLTN